MTLTARPRLGILLVVLAALVVAAATLVLYSGSTKPVQAQPVCLLGQVNDFKVESSGGAFTATWDYPDGCDATTFPDDFSLQVHWKRVFSINVGSDGDGVTWDDGSWDDFRVASCEQATVTTMCTFGRNTIETGEQFVVRVETIGNNGEETTRRVEAWPVVASNPPDPVTGTVASPEANDSCTVTSGRKATPIELSWNAVSGISNYQIWRAGSETHSPSRSGPIESWQTAPAAQPTRTTRIPGGGKRTNTSFSPGAAAPPTWTANGVSRLSKHPAPTCPATLARRTAIEKTQNLRFPGQRLLMMEAAT